MHMWTSYQVGQRNWRMFTLREIHLDTAEFQKTWRLLQTWLGLEERALFGFFGNQTWGFGIKGPEPSCWLMNLFCFCFLPLTVKPPNCFFNPLFSAKGIALEKHSTTHPTLQGLGFHFYLFTYVWLCWVLLCAGFSLNCGGRASHCRGFSYLGAGSRRKGFSSCTNPSWTWWLWLGDFISLQEIVRAFSFCRA